MTNEFDCIVIGTGASGLIAAANSHGNPMSVHGSLDTGRRAATEVLHAVQPSILYCY